MTDRPKYEDAARHLLARLALPLGAVTIRQTLRQGGQRIIVAALEPGARPEETPDQVDGFEIEYQQRKVLKVR